MSSTSPMPRSTRLSVVLAVTLSMVPISIGFAGDVIQIGKKRVRGALVKTEGGVAHVSPYNTRIARAVRGVERYPADKVKRIHPPKDPAARYLRQLNRICPPGQKTTAALEVQAGEAALEHGFKAVAEDHFLNALAHDFRNAAAREKFEELELKRRFKADPRFNAQLHEALQKWFAIEKLAERKAELAKLGRQHGFPHNFRYMERVRRSREQKRGRRDDVRLTLNSKTDKGVYTIFVPKQYDPLHPMPLLIGLHGGGTDGKDRTDVVGSGRSAMHFYQRGAGRFGYIVVCPTAVRAPWRHKMNDSFVRSVIEEVCALYNVDLNRVYLTGHSMGGFGTWHFGPKYCERWAAISPMAGGGHNNLAKLRKTQTPVYLYHGADDAVVGCGDSRAAAESMRKAGDDFVYAEIPDSGHGFPQDVRNEMWDFFHARRLATSKKRTAKGKLRVQLRPYSSFSEPPTKAERLYLGTPGEASSADKKTLLARLKLGGGGARDAADGLIALGDKSVVAPLSALLRSKKVGDDVKRESVRALGALGLPAGVKPLLRALGKLPLDLVPDVARALQTLHSAAPKASADIAKRLAKTMKRVDDEFDRRLTGDQMAFSDWKRCMGAYEALARAIAVTRDAGTVPAIKATCDRVLLKTWRPRSSRRARLDPARPLGACVAAVIAALRAIGREGTAPLIDQLNAKHGGLSEVRRARAR